MKTVYFAHETHNFTHDLKFWTCPRPGWLHSCDKLSLHLAVHPLPVCPSRWDSCWKMPVLCTFTQLSWR
jgi:hypothetical protein